MSSFGISFVSDAVAPWNANPRVAKTALVCYCTAVGSSMLMEKTFTIFEIPARNLLGDKSITDSAYTILLVVDALGGPIFGRVAQRYGVRCCLIIGFVLFLSTTAVLTTGVTLATFYIGHFAAGLAMSAIYAPCNIAAVQLMPHTKQSLASSLSMFSIVACSAICVYPIRQVIERYGAHIGYCAQGLIISSCLGLCALFLPAQPAASAQANESTAHLEVVRQTSMESTKGSKYLSFTVLYIGYLAGVSTYYFLEAQIQPILEDTLPQNHTVLEVALTFFLVEEGIVRMVWGYIALQRSAALCLVAGVVMVALSFNLWAIFSGACFAELVTVAMSFLGATSLWPLMPVLVARIFPPSEAMALYALLNTAGVVAGIISGPVAAILSSSCGWPTTLHIFSVLPVIVAVALLMRIWKDEKRALSRQNSRQESPREGIIQLEM